MKKNCYGILCVMAAVLLLGGCEKETDDKAVEQETELQEIYISAEDDAYVPVVEEVFSEEVVYPQLAEFLIEYYQIPEEYQTETRYYYNYVDLNEDDISEIFVVVVGDYTKHSAGYPALILSVGEDSEFAVIEAFMAIHTPITISEQTTNGWHDIIYYTYGRDEEDGYRICRYNPDGGYQTQLSEIAEELEPTGGVQIISNNFIDDMDKGRYLTLVPQTEDATEYTK